MCFCNSVNLLDLVKVSVEVVWENIQVKYSINPPVAEENRCQSTDEFDSSKVVDLRAIVVLRFNEY